MISTALQPESAQVHVTRIRREKFSLDKDGRLLSQNPLAGDLHDSVDLLSAGLYSKDIHFVLELIQNAEDNAYPPHTQPELLFRMLLQDPTSTPGANGALLLINNECGLRPQDVDALCAVGKSTKTKRQGYIGEKGIGFKSVFKVTRRPHLYSAGYQFRFDRDPDPEAKLGYIIPYWVDAEPAEVAGRRGQTCIVLPLDDGQWEPVVEQLQSIAPETILFLKRLEGLSVELSGAPPLTLAADKTAPPLVHLLDDDGLNTYWVHNHEVACPPDKMDEKRVGVDTRVISVAFPLDVVRAPDYSVFAYLPTEVHSGYPFLVNADFILSTSRETILVDRLWNGWLRDEIAPCFVEGFASLVLDPKYCYQAYSFIPLTEEVPTEFFRRAVAKIHAQLKTRPVVWVQGQSDPVLPSTARLAPPTFRALLVADRRLPQQLSTTPLVRSEIEQYSRQLRAIGVTTLQAEEVRACLQDEGWLRDRTPEWFVKLFAHLQQDKWRVPASYEREARSLEGLSIVPTSDGRLATVGKEAVYLPEPAAEALAREHADLLGGLQSVAFLSTDLFHSLTNRPELLDWVKRELARPWTPEAYCRDLVKALGAGVAHLPVTDLVRATKIVRDLVEKVKGTSARELCDGLPVRLENGSLAFVRRWVEADMVTPTNLDPDTGWQRVFVAPQDRAGLQIISPAYMESCTDPAEREHWARFFDAISVSSVPFPLRSWEWMHYLYLPADMPSDLQVQIKDAGYRASNNDGFSLDDLRLPGWLEQGNQTASLTPSHQQRLALLDWLRRALDRGLLEARRMEWKYYSRYYIEIRSHLRHVLQTTTWFPSTKGARRPGEVFLDRREVREIFGDTVPYATETIDTRLAEWLGVRQSATVSEVLGYLGQLAERPAEEVSAILVQRIYTFLMERWRADNSAVSKEQRGQFALRPMIRVEHPSAKWVLRDDAIWANRSDVFGDDFAYLEPGYPARLREFFVDQLPVKADAEDELYARTWLRHQRASDPDPSRVEAALERIFPILVRVAESDSLPLWWRSFLTDAKVWTQGNHFVPPSEAYIPDDGALKKILGRAGANFVWRPTKDSFADYEALYRALGVRSLVETTACSLGVDIRPEATPAGEEAYLCAPAKRGICFYLWDRSKEEFKRLKDDGILAALLGSAEASVDCLVLQYQLDGISATDSDAVAYFDRTKSTLYLSAATPPARLDVEVPAHLARVLSKGRPAEALRDFIARIAGKTEQHLQYLSEQNDWHLPLEEREWMERAIAGQLDWPTQAAENHELTAESVPPVAAVTPTTSDAGQKDDSQFDQSVPAPAQAEGPKSAEPVGGTGQTIAGVPTGHGQISRPDEGHTPDSRGDGHARRDSQGPEGQASGQRAAGAPAAGPGHLNTEDLATPGLHHDETPTEKRPRGRRPAYLEPEGTSEHHGQDVDSEESEAIERAGVQAAEAFELKHGRKPKVLEGNHPGWDIESFEIPFGADAAPDRRIEVKAKGGVWDGWGIALTPTEYESARRFGDSFYLYVVEHALDAERRRIHVFRNPAAKVEEYCFDDGWRAHADETE